MRNDETMRFDRRDSHVSLPSHLSHLIPHHSPWQIGLIVGPSGSGKSTIARAMFGDRVYRPREWPTDRAVIDGLGDAADQGNHPPVHRRRVLLAAELDQALPGPEQRRAVPLRPGPGAGGRGQMMRGGMRKAGMTERLGTGSCPFHHSSFSPSPSLPSSSSTSSPASSIATSRGSCRRRWPRASAPARSAAGWWPSPATTT